MLCLLPIFNPQAGTQAAKGRLIYEGGGTILMGKLKKLWASGWRVPIVCVAFALLPFLLALPGGIVGVLLGCTLNEAGTDPCVRLGIQVGPLIYHSTVLPWFSLLTFPIGFGALALWAIGKWIAIFSRGK